MKPALTVLAVVILIWLGWSRFVIRPYRCDVAVRSSEEDLVRLASGATRSSLVPRECHRILNSLEPCTQGPHPDPDALMISAAVYRLMGAPGTASALYTEVLKVERRPEVFLNRGLSRIDARDEKGGFEDLLAAAEYDSEIVVQGVLNLDLRQRVLKELEKRRSPRKANSGKQVRSFVRRAMELTA